MEHLLSLQNLLNLSVLTMLEIVLGIDNVIFIALLVQPLSQALRTRVRIAGLSLALILRIIMLFLASNIAMMVEPIFTIHEHHISGRSLLFIAGGGFLVIKAIMELIELFREKEIEQVDSKPKSILLIVLQIILIDVLLSFDSIITAVGISNNLPIIITSIIISMIIMIISAKPVGDFIYKHHNIKVIALAFIIFLGVFLVASGFDIDIPKGYLYFSLLFSIIVEIINIKLAQKIKHSQVDIKNIL